MAAFDEHVSDLFGDLPNKLGDELLWKLVDNSPAFWANMPPKPDAFVLWDAIEKYHPTFLTGCPKTNFDHAAQAKGAWVLKHFGVHPVITCFSKDKPQHMQAKGDVLIDDFIRNIKRWETAGGVGIYHKSAERTIPKVQALMDGTP